MFDNYFNTDLNYYIHCKYNFTTVPKCPVFILEDIVNYMKNNQDNYEMIAKHGAEINFNIKWLCFKPFHRAFNVTYDCRIDYSWYRIDNERSIPVLGYRTTRRTFYFKDMSRTHWKTHTIKINFYVNATLYYYNLWHFLIILSASYGFYKSAMSIFDCLIKIFIKTRYSQYEFDQIVQIEEGESSNVTNDYETIESSLSSNSQINLVTLI